MLRDLPHFHQSLRYRYYEAATLLLAACLLASCSSSLSMKKTDRYGPTLGPISAQQIARDALAHLAYPGSVPFFHVHQGTNDASLSDGPAGSGT